MSRPRIAAEVTVGITTFGRPDALRSCLASLERGTVLPGEVIVVDQASRPETEELVAGCGLPRLLYLKDDKTGVSHGRNLVLARASGSLLAITDDDCAPEPGWLEGVLAAFSREPRPVAVTGPVLAPVGPRPQGHSAVSLRTSLIGKDHVGRQPPWHIGTGGNFAASTEVLRRLRGWDVRLGPGSDGRAAEDVEMLYRVLRVGTVRYAPEAIVRHEWQSDARQMASRWSYGFGTGTFFGILTRGRDRFLLPLLRDYLTIQGRALLLAVRDRDRSRTSQQLRILAGLLSGFLHGVRLAAPADAA